MIAMLHFLMVNSIALIILGPSALGADSFAAKKKQFQLLFNQVPIKSIAGVPYEGGPVSLDYKEFINSEAKGMIVLVHGFTEHFFRYQELIYDFYHMGYSILIYNQRGHGASQFVNEASVYVDDFDYYVEDLHHIITMAVRRSKKPLLLFGHSMGGAVVARFMEKYPDLADAAILSAPMIKIKTGAVPVWLAKVVTDLAVRWGFAKELVPGHKLPQPEPWSFEQSGTGSKERYQHDIEAVFQENIRYWMRSGATFGFVSQALKNSEVMLRGEELDKLVKPVIIFQAENDKWVDNDAQNQFCGSLKRCELVPMSESKHVIHKQIDDIRNRQLSKIKEFLERVIPRTIASFH